MSKLLSSFFIILVCSFQFFANSEVDVNSQPIKKKSSQEKLTKSIRHTFSIGYRDPGDEYAEMIAEILLKTDSFNILGDEEDLDKHFGRMGTVVHFPRSPFNRRVFKGRHLKDKPTKLKITQKQKLTDRIIDKKKHFRAKNQRLLSEIQKPKSTKLKKMFSKLFSDVGKLNGKNQNRKLKFKSRRLRGGVPGGVNSAAASPQINDSRIIVHAFAAPAAAPQSYIRAPYSNTEPQVIQARMQLH